jgi:O-antigen ligase
MFALLGHHIYKKRLYRASFIPFSVMALALIAALIWQWPLLMTRVTGEGRLEVRSVTERVSGVQAGLTVFSEHPWVGVGRNAFAIAYDVYPIPHNIPLLMLVETGLIGVSATILLLMLFYRSIQINKSRLALIGLPLLAIAMLDHYLWSYWPGHVLAMLSVIWCFLVSHNIDRTEKLG